MNISTKDFISAGIGLLTGLGAAITFMWMNFVTVEASEQRWQAHNQAIVCQTVADLEAEKRELEARLQFDPNLTQQQREFLKQQIAELKEQIKQKDPQGLC